MSSRIEIKFVRQIRDISCHILPLRLVYTSGLITIHPVFSGTSNYSSNFKFRNSHSKKLDIAETLDFGLKYDTALYQPSCFYHNSPTAV